MGKPVWVRLPPAAPFGFAPHTRGYAAMNHFPIKLNAKARPVFSTSTDWLGHFRAISSTARAPSLHDGGSWFESRIAHHSTRPAFGVTHSW